MEMMMHTEEEAKTKICPQSFAIPEVRDADGCGIREGGPVRCCGSACMAWQWNDPPTERVEAVIMGHRPDGDGWVCELKDEGREKYSVKSIWVRPNPTRRGYCGLVVRT